MMIMMMSSPPNFELPHSHSESILQYQTLLIFWQYPLGLDLTLQMQLEPAMWNSRETIKQ